LSATLAVLAYLLGAVPMGLIVSRLRGLDLRRHGSGNIGATNAGRVLGRRYAVLVVALDFAKGGVPVWVARSVLGERASAAVLWCAVAAVAGHVFPVYLRFRGGKGVATAAGAFFALQPIAAAVALTAWFAVLLASRYVSMASLVGAWLYPFAVALLSPPREAAPLSAAASAVALLITFRHRTNLQRLWCGQEPKIGRRPAAEV